MSDEGHNETWAGWMGFRRAEDIRQWRGLGGFVGWCVTVLGLIWLFLLLATVGHLFLLFGGAESFLREASFAMGAIVAAVLGAPFVIWGTVIKQQTVDFQKEGHMTDRISKAVEQLGAEKTVKRIRRDAKGKPVLCKDADGQPDPDQPVIDEITVPNIEVRIGGLLSLERISQDSVRHDKGRDHVRVMEILCAYIRENAKAEDAKVFAPHRPHTTSGTTKSVDTSHGGGSSKREPFEPTELRDWIKTLPKPRQDVQLALNIIGRRPSAAKDVEANWRNDRRKTLSWPFSEPLPTKSTLLSKMKKLKKEGIAFIEEPQVFWRGEPKYSGYSIDLRNTNLQGTDLRDLCFSHASFKGAKLDGAQLALTRVVRASLRGTSLKGAFLFETTLVGAVLDDADLACAIVSGSDFSCAYCHNVDLRFSRVFYCEFSFSYFSNCDFFDAFLDNNLFFAPTATLVFSQTAEIRQCAFKHATIRDLTKRTPVPSLKDETENSFGDATVSLLGDVQKPKHWASWDLPEDTFVSEWHNWRAKPNAYTPPPQPDH